ncbi:MAG TPA: hypothetical protein VED16_02325 [Candidatus Acidoferrum sp.]|nr:hypothetical protein [Candidatus Acidoferrum sp.]
MPEVKDEEVGRRLFQIHKEKAVEVAIEKIRRKMRLEWASFTSSDIDILKYILGEAWVCIKRAEWEGISFTKLTKNDLQEIIQVAKQVNNKEKAEKLAIDEICNALISKG